MQKFILALFTVLFLSTILDAQTTVFWDGDADTDWNNPLNWDNDVVPTALDTAVFNTNVTVTGSAPAAPVMLRLFNGAQVIFDLDLSVGDGVTANNAVELQSGSRLVLENSRTMNVLTGTGKNGIQIGSGSNATVNIKGTATLNITGGQHGINVSNPDAEFVMRGTTNINDVDGNAVRLTAGTFDNRGSLNIMNSGGNGIDNSGMFTNTASSTTAITIDGANNNAIKNKAGATFTNQKAITITNSAGNTNDGICSVGTFANEAGATISVTTTEDDGLDLQGGSFANDGTITVTLKDGAGAGNGGIVVGKDTESATLTNTSNNSINIDGGTGSGRSIIVEAMGEVTNTGTITVTGGDDGARIANEGVFTNGMLATVDLTDGRINNSGTFTNDGLVVSTRGGSAIFSTGTANNNAFFKYDGSNNFANGTGSVNDLGISLNQFSARVIDVVDGGVVVDIAEVPYTWNYNGTPVGTADATGMLTVDCNLIDNDTISIRPDILDFGSTPIRLRGVCVQQLPVEFSRIEAVSMPKSIMVKWQTAVEESNDYMAVERSNDGQSFSEIGRVAGAGFSLSFNDYELEDHTPVTGVNYYRLRQVDFDGAVNYSEVVSARFSGSVEEENRSLVLFPTVIARGQVINADLRSLPAEQKVAFKITDANGRVVDTRILNSGEVTPLTLGALPPGIYYLSGSGDLSGGARFIVQ